jgi:flagellar hook-associated protein 2
LTGDSATSQIVNTLQSILGSQTTAAGTTASDSWLAEIGVSVNSDGTLALNSSQFQAALSANPSAVAAMFTSLSGTGSQQGFAVQINNAIRADARVQRGTGSAQQSLNSQITYMNSQQASMQTQLAQEQASLTQEYSKLNAALAAAQSEQTSLAGELAQLPG